MKTIVIGDLHGKDIWKSFVSKNPNSYFIFLGDYTDSSDKSNEVVIANLKEIIEFKKANMKKVTLLLGNHDVPYYFLNDIVKHKANIPYNSNTDFTIGWDLYDVFFANRGLFQVAYQIGNNLFTHAGVSEKWFKNNEEVIMNYWKQDLKMNLADVLNGIENTQNKTILFGVGYARGGRGDGGIVWSCQEETKFGTLKGYHQFVGHTRQEKINTIKFDENTSITYCDVLSNKTPEFLTLDI